MLLVLWPVWLVVVSILSSGYFYVEATKSGMKRKNWALAGLVLGPMLFPLFTIHRFILLKKNLNRADIWLNG